jgi:transposase
MSMPADPRDLLPGQHLVWGVLEQAALLDMSVFEARYRADGQGARPYDPRMMVTLLLYCYCKGQRSSREIEMATYDDVGARVICGNLHPDHATAARFVVRHEADIRGLLPQSVAACARAGLLCLDVVAGDGTKLKASASMDATVTVAALEEQIADLEALVAAEVDAWVQQHLDADDADDDRGAARPAAGPGSGGEPPRAAQTLARRKAARAHADTRAEVAAERDQPKLAARVAVLEQRLARKEAAAAKERGKAQARREHWQVREAAAAAAGRKVFGREAGEPDAAHEVIRTREQVARTARKLADARAALAGAPAAAESDAKVNTTDWTSRIMPLKKGGYDQLHNAQALATAGTQVIIAITRFDNPADCGALHPLLAEARRVLAQAGISEPIGKAVFDTGYASSSNFTADAGGTELYVAITRDARQAGRSSDGRDPAAFTEPGWQDMTARLETPEGQAVYKRRSPTIEPVFAQLTSRLGRALNYRGDLTDAELSLWAASRNFLKAITASLARQTRPAALAAA